MFYTDTVNFSTEILLRALVLPLPHRSFNESQSLIKTLIRENMKQAHTNNNSDTGSPTYLYSMWYNAMLIRFKFWGKLNCGLGLI